MKPEEKFHNHHEQLIGKFEDRCAGARREPENNLSELVDFLRGELLPHARAEESELYDAVDRLDQGELATASMRKDHEILEDRIESLSTYADDSGEDVRRKLDEFSAILLNHFHKEEGILIPFLNQKLDDDEFEDLLGRVHRAEENLNQAHECHE